jgi:ABC-type molybdate transport system ATPase subunit
MAALTLEQIDRPSSGFSSGLSLEVDGTFALVGPSGAGEDDRLTGDRRARQARAGRSRRTTSLVRRRSNVLLAAGAAAGRLVFQDYALFPH